MISVSDFKQAISYYKTEVEFRVITQDINNITHLLNREKIPELPVNFFLHVRFQKP